MARVVVLSFKDNDAAEAFCQHVLDAQAEVYADIPIAISATVVAHAEIEALVARPTAYCKCTIVGKSGRARPSKSKFNTLTESWGRTKRFGWYVHRRCNRVNYFVFRDFIKNMLIASGSDLLPELKEKMNADVGEVEGEHNQVAKQGEQSSQGTSDSEEPRQLLPSVQASADPTDVSELAPIDDGPRHWLTND